MAGSEARGGAAVAAGHPAPHLALVPPVASPPWRRARTSAEQRCSLARPVPPETAALTLRLGGSLFLAGSLGGLVVVLVSPDIVANVALLVGTVTGAAVVGVALLLASARSPHLVADGFGLLAHVVLVIAPANINIGLYAVGPRSLVGAVMHAEIPIFAMNLLARRRAAIVLALQSLGFGAVLLSRPGYPAPLVHWFFLTVTLVAVGWSFGGLLNRAVDATDQLGRLRRFLAPQVAEAVLSTGAVDRLAPHRRRIAVVFVDLRGFTRFSNASEPEEVVEVLGEYFAAVGALLAASGATVGGFAGDGVMAYFNDPVPCDDPAGRAVDLALRARPVLDDLVRTWRRHGFELGYGIGITYGYATLGVVGFEGRSDYTPLGAVVNLAARLCGEAASGEILVDERAFDALGGRLEADRVTVSVKGFTEPVRAHRLAAADVAEIRPVRRRAARSGVPD